MKITETRVWDAVLVVEQLQKLDIEVYCMKGIMVHNPKGVNTPDRLKSRFNELLPVLNEIAGRDTLEGPEFIGRLKAEYRRIRQERLRIAEARLAKAGRKAVADIEDAVLTMLPCHLL